MVLDELDDAVGEVLRHLLQVEVRAERLEALPAELLLLVERLEAAIAPPRGGHGW